MLEIRNNEGNGETGIPKVVEVTEKGVVAEPGFNTVVRKTEKRRILVSTISKEPAEEEPKNKKPGEIEEINLETSGAEKILFKINVANRENIPKGLRHETAFVPIYSVRRDAEAAKNGLSAEEVAAQQPGVKHTGYDMGKSHSA